LNDDRGHGAMPKLYGAPAYARPPVLPVNPVEKPFDPDDLPLEAVRKHEIAEPPPAVQPQAHEQASTAEAVSTAEAPPDDNEASRSLNARPFRIRLPGRGHDGR
jgi:hypothetical protein